MPRKKVSRTPPVKRSEEVDDDDFFFDDTSSNSGRSPHEPQHRNAANARERARMRVLSKAFCRLKTTLPWVPADTKLSKLDTLRLAASYIAHLRALLHEPRSAQTAHPLSLAWPFAFQHGGSLSCTLSQRWSLNTSTGACAEPNRNLPREPDIPENYPQEYEADFEDRSYEERSYDEKDCNQYCNYGYKGYYYGMRNSYSTENLMNM